MLCCLKDLPLGVLLFRGTRQHWRHLISFKLWILYICVSNDQRTAENLQPKCRGTEAEAEQVNVLACIRGNWMDIAWVLLMFLSSTKPLGAQSPLLPAQQEESIFAKVAVNETHPAKRGFWLFLLFVSSTLVYSPPPANVFTSCCFSKGARRPL